MKSEAQSESMPVRVTKRSIIEMKKQKSSAVGISLNVVELPADVTTEQVVDCVVQVAKEYGLNYSGSARQFIKDDFNQFDLIIGMDASNLSNILSLANEPEDEDKVHLMREFDPEGSPTDPVPDPYYDRGLDGFHKVYRIVERSCRALLDKVENGELDLS